MAVSEQHQLLAAANCGPPTASSSVKVYSTAAKSCGELVVELPVNAPSDLVLQVRALMLYSWGPGCVWEGAAQGRQCLCVGEVLSLCGVWGTFRVDASGKVLMF